MGLVAATKRMKCLSPPPCAVLELTHRRLNELEHVASILPAGTLIAIPSFPGDEPETLLALIEQVQRFGYRAIPHIAARRFRDERALGRFLERAVKHGSVDRMLLLAGDESQAKGRFHSAQCVIDTGLIAKHGIRQIAVAGYPEGHPRITPQHLVDALQRKLTGLQQQGIQASITTQLSTRPSAVAAWIASMRQVGIKAPITVSIAGPAKVESLRRLAMNIGIEFATLDSKESAAPAAAEAETVISALLNQLQTMLPIEAAGEISLNVQCLSVTRETAIWFMRGRESRWRNPLHPTPVVSTSDLPDADPPKV